MPPKKPNGKRLSGSVSIPSDAKNTIRAAVRDNR